MRKTVLLALLGFCGYVGEVWSGLEYEAYPQDVRDCTSRALISGIRLSDGQSALTVAFNEAAKVRHAYLVFETKRQGNITLQGLHFGGTDCCFDYYQGRLACCDEARTEIRVDDHIAVLKKCHRALKQEYKETASGRQAVGRQTHSDPFYKKHSTFVISTENADKPWGRIDGWREGAGKIEFSLWGDVFSAQKHNCCSFVALCLREATLPISFKGIWARSPENLKYYAKEYVTTKNDPQQAFLH